MAEEGKKYEGACYIGVVGAETENDECRDSIEAITRREGDDAPHFIRATKGYEARQMHLNKWYDETELPFLLLLDRDMKFPPDALEKLRSHGLPYVSGLYMRRRYNPMAPVWFEYNAEPGVMPMVPFTQIPHPQTLYRIGASGWGCILMHRDVVTGVRALLKGEPEIIEDDMDIYPYDLGRVMGAIRMLDNPASVKKGAKILREEIRPLRAMKDMVGSDIRFPFYARLAGFDLWGDASVMCDHMLNYPLSPSDYINQPAVNVRDLMMHMHGQVQEEYERIEKAKAALQ